MDLIAYSLGKQSLSELGLEDLCTLDPFLSRATGVQLGYISPEEQEEFFSSIQPLPPYKEQVNLPSAHLLPETGQAEQGQIH